MKRMAAAKLAVMTAAVAGAFATPAAQARPTYCVQQAWYYADSMAGPDRQTPEWSYYNAAFQDYNDCYGENACNDRDIPCQDPPA